jgi:hypothetical protein
LAEDQEGNKHHKSTYHKTDNTLPSTRSIYTFLKYTKKISRIDLILGYKTSPSAECSSVPVVVALRSLKQESREFEASLNDITRPWLEPSPPTKKNPNKSKTENINLPTISRD